MAAIQFKIITPERVVYQQIVDQVSLPSKEGEITILPNHLALVTVLKPGEVIVKQGETRTSLAIFGGFVEVKDNEVMVLTENAEPAEEIDEARAQAARTRAQQLMIDTKSRDDVDYSRLVAKLERELTRLKVARKRKYKDVGRPDQA